MKFNEFTSKEQILEIAQQVTSKVEFLKFLGYKKNGGNERSLRQLEKKFDIDLNELYSRRTTIEQYLKNPKYCQYCGKVISFKQRKNKFCSSSCAITANNYKRGKKEKPVKINTKEEQDRIKLAKFEQGENFVRGGCQVPSFIRRYFINKYNNKCQLCGWGKMNPLTGKIPLALHHIDGDCTNNTIGNLQLLCPNCHSLTDNFGVLNKNSKRFHRRKITKNNS